MKELVFVKYINFSTNINQKYNALDRQQLLLKEMRPCSFHQTLSVSRATFVLRRFKYASHRLKT